MRFLTILVPLTLMLLIAPPFLQTGEAAKPARHNAAQASEQSRKGPEKPAAVSGQTVKTDYFSILLPKDWFMAYPVSKKQQDIAAVFSNDKTRVTITLNVIRAPLSIKKFTDLIIGSMKQSGLQPSLPVATGKMNKIILNGKAKGEAWLASNGKLCTATVILAPQSDIHSASAFLGELRSGIGDMFPTHLN